jgi:hypothetical protein
MAAFFYSSCGWSANHMNTITSELIRRCEERRLCTATTQACAVLGEAIDAGIVSLPDLLAMVRSAKDADQLGDMLTVLAASSYCLIPAPAGRTFRIVGIPEEVLEVPTWNR